MQVHRSSHSVGRIQPQRDVGGGTLSPGMPLQPAGSGGGATSAVHKATRGDGRGAVSKSLTFASKHDHDLSQSISQSDAQRVVQPQKGLGRAVRTIGNRLEALVARPMFGAEADVDGGMSLGRLHAMKVPPIPTGEKKPLAAVKQANYGSGQQRASTGCILPGPAASLSPGGGGRRPPGAADAAVTSGLPSKGRPQLPSILSSSGRRQSSGPAPPPLLPRFYRASEPHHSMDEERTSSASSAEDCTAGDTTPGVLMVTAHIGVHPFAGAAVGAAKALPVSARSFSDVSVSASAKASAARAT